MTEILVTGATGTVGHPIARRLAEAGDHVRALVRSPERAAASLPDGVEAVAGDVTDAASVRDAVAGASVVYHAAGMPEQWRLDRADFTRVNVDGTRNVVEAALAAGVERFAYTSTIDVFAWTPGEPFDESVIDPEPRPTHYERSKQDADRIVVDATQRGLDAVFLHPSGVYGPAPVLAAGANQLLADLATRKVPMLLPGGFPVVYNEDVAEGHLRAVAEAPAGARFILSDAYLTLVELAEAVKRRVADAKVPPVMPIAVARAVSNAGERIARVIKRPPLIPRGALHFLESHAVPVAEHARAELKWEPRSAEDGIASTLEHFRDQGWV
ncbi:MAG: SDR family NAD(P)-dependent oxidoreductase [Solirubrobacterales bacterium]|nr:SDR family NAD(P)-dependent oxidoreductase [Solirubrobacterales bacterium]